MPWLKFRALASGSRRSSLNGVVNNEEYAKRAQCLCKELSQFRGEYIRLARVVIGDSLLLEDFYYEASIDRSMRLIDGFIPLFEQRNLACVGALLRLQMDNCMRAYAGFIAADKAAFFEGYLQEGKRVCDFKDVLGNKMKDSVLVREISKVDERFFETYKWACDFVHFSDMAFYSIVEIGDEYDIGLRIGHPYGAKPNHLLLECAKAFCHYISLHQSLVMRVAEAKGRFDERTRQETQ